MVKWPGWSAPLLGVIGGAGGGLALTGDPRNHFVIWQAALGGAVAGMVAGLIVWSLDKGRLMPLVLREIEAGLIPELDLAPARADRRDGLRFLVIGLTCLAANHALVEYAEKKFLPLVLGGSFFTAAGLAGLALPQLLTAGWTGENVPWWGHVLGGVLAVGGLAFGTYLWLLIY